MSTCERFQMHLNDFLDGTLGATHAQELNAHLEGCVACRREYHALKTTQELVRNVAVPGGEEAQQRVMARFRQAVRPEAERAPAPVRPPLFGWRTPLWSVGAVAAMAGVLLLVAWPQMHRAQKPFAASNEPIVIATAACASGLPTADDLDEMASAHAVQSLTMQNGSEEAQQEALADANSRLAPDHAR